MKNKYKMKRMRLAKYLMTKYGILIPYQKLIGRDQWVKRVKRAASMFGINY